MHLGNSPPKLLTFISNIVRYVALVKEQRKLKSFAPPFPSLLRPMTKTETPFNFSKEGTPPLSLFPENWSNLRFEALDIEIGIGPINRLMAMLNFSIFGRVIPISDGRCPWIWLNATSKYFNKDKLKIERGIFSDNLFEVTPIYISLVNWPKVVGIFPPKLLGSKHL